MDISVIGLPVLAHSAVFYLKDEAGEVIKDESGKEIGIELWSMDSKQGLKAQIASGRIRAQLEESIKDLSEEDAQVERIFAIKEINLQIAAMMFKSVVGNLTLDGTKIDQSNITDVLRRLKASVARDIVQFVQTDDNYIAKP